MAKRFDSTGERFHFAVMGFPVYVAWDFVFAVLWGLSDWRTTAEMVEWGVVVFLSILLHELGHALAYRHYGSPARIRLWGLGGLTFGSGPRTRRAAVVTSLAGPVLALVVVGIPAYLAFRAGVVTVTGDRRFWWVTLRDIYWVNLFWSLVNLLPILPLDGGNVCDALYGRRAARVASIATGVGGAAIAYQGYDMGRLALMALLLAGYNAYCFAKERPFRFGDASGYPERFDESQPGDDPDRHPPAPARPSAWTPTDRPTVSEVEGWLALERGDVKQATDLVGRMTVKPPMLAGAVLARNGRRTAAVAAFGSGYVAGAIWPPVAFDALAEAELAGLVADWVLSSDPGHGRVLASQMAEQLRDASHARAAAEVVEVLARTTRWGPDIGRSWYTAACSWADADDPERAVAALEEAVKSGFGDVAMVRLEPSFAGLHGIAGFDRLLPPPGGSSR